VAVVRPIFAAALLATVLGLIFEFAVPASGRIIDIGAVVFGLSTWIVPPLLAALSWSKKRSSLASVGFTIYLFAVAGVSLLSVFRLRSSASFSCKMRTGPGSLCWPLRPSGYRAGS
jgi:hypothetical protein